MSAKTFEETLQLVPPGFQWLVRGYDAETETLTNRPVSVVCVLTRKGWMPDMERVEIEGKITLRATEESRKGNSFLGFGDTACDALYDAVLQAVYSNGGARNDH